MKSRVAAVIFCLTVSVPAAFCQHAETAPEKAVQENESFAERHELELKWINFLLLAGGLGYLIGKNSGPFFAARSRTIRKDLEDSELQRKEAETRAAAVDARLADLGKEIEALRNNSQTEAQAENDRMAKHTSAEIAKIQAQAEQEIESAGKAARLELKRYAAQLSVDLAENRIRGRMTPSTQQDLVRSFVNDLTPDRTLNSK